ncbi:DUF4249 domain-containing protein [bacterium]|nr:DUF4249 domain-containing protein [bacterium]
MKKQLLALLVLIISAVMVSCEKEAKEIELPKVDPKLVVYGFLSPSDSVIEIVVSKSVPYFGDQKGNIYDPVSDATVLLSSEGQTISLPFSIENGSYIVRNEAPFSILAGKTYSLQVSSPGGFYVSAATTVPSSLPNQVKVEIDSSIRTSNGFNEKIYRIQTVFLDQPNQRDYYHGITKIYQDTLKDKRYAYTICNNFKEDEGVNGQEIRLNCNYSNFYSGFDGANSFSGFSVLYTTDISYFKYHVSLDNYIEDNPFAEPSRVYSNINGGLGCLGSYLATEVEF